MGANSEFNERLPTIASEANGQANAWRQVEVFTFADDLHLRIGPINQENVGVDRYTIKLTREAADRLIAAIKGGQAYLGDR